MYCILTGHAGIDTEGKRDLRQHSSMTFKLRPGGFNGYKFYIFCKPVLKYRTETKKKKKLGNYKQIISCLNCCLGDQGNGILFLGQHCFPKNYQSGFLAE